MGRCFPTRAARSDGNPGTYYAPPLPARRLGRRARRGLRYCRPAARLAKGRRSKRPQDHRESLGTVPGYACVKARGQSLGMYACFASDFLAECREQQVAS